MNRQTSQPRLIKALCNLQKKYKEEQMIEDAADTIENRRKLKKRGLRGTDWYLYKEGIPPEDNYDYTWNGFQWIRDDD